MQPSYLEFKTLLGHSGLSFSIECLSSFVNSSKEPIRLKIFEDGTLNEKDKELLRINFPDSVLIDVDECTKKVVAKLDKYPACLHYRKSVIYARKIFDLMLYDEQDCWYLDSDIFFLQQFSLPKFKNEPAFMYDSQNGYSFKPGEFLKIKHPLYPKVNSGFFFFPFKQFDLDFIEQLLQNKVVFQGFLRGISWLEQTIWAFLAYRCGSMYYFDSRQVIMATEKTQTTADTICVHLVSSYRNQFEKVKAKQRKNEQTPVANIRLVKAKLPLKARNFFIERVIKRLRRYL